MFPYFPTPAQQNEIFENLSEIATGSYSGGDWGGQFKQTPNEGPLYAQLPLDVYLLQIVALLDSGSDTSDHAVVDSNGNYYARILTPLNTNLDADARCLIYSTDIPILARVSHCATLHEGDIMIGVQMGLTPNAGNAADQGKPLFIAVADNMVEGWAYSDFHTTADDFTLTWDGGAADGTLSGGVRTGNLYLDSNKIKTFNGGESDGLGYYMSWLQTNWRNTPADNYYTLLDTSIDPTGNFATMNANLKKTPILLVGRSAITVSFVESGVANTLHGGFMNSAGYANNYLPATGLCLGYPQSGNPGQNWDVTLSCPGVKTGLVNVTGRLFVLKVQQKRHVT